MREKLYLYQQSTEDGKAFYRIRHMIRMNKKKRR